MAKRMIVMLLTTALIVGALGFVKFKQIQTAIGQAAAFQPPPEAVTTIVAVQERWPSMLSAIGTMAAVQGVNVSADLPGTVDRIGFDSGQTVRAGYDGALDVDVIFSPFFNTLPIRRTGLYRGNDSLSVPVVYVSLPDLAVNPVTISYSSASDGIKLHSPVAETTITVDDEGFILDYPGLAERI